MSLPEPDSIPTLASPSVTKAAAQRLTEAGVEQPALDARLLLAHALGIDANAMRLKSFPVSAGEADTFARLLAQRVARKPVAKIVGHKEFWSLDFLVDASTLDPRPDSETLIELLVALMPDKSRPLRMLDLGTGSGCLLLSALTEYPAASGLGIERHPDALAIAERNVERLGLSARAKIAEGDWADGLSERFDVILCNPPYIEEGAALMPEVAEHEPPHALYAGTDGLSDYRRLIPQLPGRLNEGGLAILEIGKGQENDVVAIAEASGLRMAASKMDLGGVTRALAFTIKEQGAPHA